LSKIEAVAEEIKASYPSVVTRVLVVDFGSMKSVREAAAKVTAYPEPTIDIFIHNAGLMDLRQEHRKTIDGIDEHLAVNFVGGFLFTNLILNKIIEAGSIKDDARIVIVASSASPISPVRFHDLNVDKAAADVPEEELPNLAVLQQFGIPTDKTYIPWVAYGQSKTAAILFAVQLGELLTGKGVTVNSLHPGGNIV
jgi:NAD(P)-dependent dehydrogenase (short-subunit alcohol dehydrogenase family)